MSQPALELPIVPTVLSIIPKPRRGDKDTAEQRRDKRRRNRRPAPATREGEMRAQVIDLRSRSTLKVDMSEMPDTVPCPHEQTVAERQAELDRLATEWLIEHAEAAEAEYWASVEASRLDQDELYSDGTECENSSELLARQISDSLRARREHRCDVYDRDSDDDVISEWFGGMHFTDRP